ncbi:caveolin-2 [Fukomys damarensis]|uniref:caveolin-2 n=1 Tax=Fukomys damarensis TaxID=885580 RepID=UPI00053F899B|nr:caveolin-2 [Fukomys damarensis]
MVSKMKVKTRVGEDQSTSKENSQSSPEENQLKSFRPILLLHRSRINPPENGHHSGIDYADPEKFVDSGQDRDPHQLNSHLKLGFDDVIAEPVTTHSFDKVWICSHALFEISKYVIYKFLTVLLAVPLAFAAGILFATLSCLHIWIVMPFIKTCLMVLPSVQTIWKSVTDVVVAPLCTSIGRIFSSVSLQLSHE